VYAYVFGGGVPHLHVHLAPNLPDGVLSTQLIEGPVEQRPLPSGATELISLNHPDLPDEELATVIERTRAMLAEEIQ
jgi:diadenosine tetraphosphate (Ap4A) HIT family hydrolase